MPPIWNATYSLHQSEPFPRRRLDLTPNLEISMTFPANPEKRFPKGDHNRRLALDIDQDVFAAEAGVTVEELRAYELSPPNGPFDPAIAEKVGRALEMMEALKAPRVDNGPAPGNRH
jgi:hypothetical protein